jgi:hypothetical protein
MRRWPDPWQFLLDAPALSQKNMGLLRAAQSWLAGLRVLCRLSTGVATLSTDWLTKAEDAKASGDLPQYIGPWAKSLINCPFRR